MEIKVNIGFEQLLFFLKHLAFEEKKKIFTELQKEFLFTPKKANKLQQILLKGPTWSEKEFKNYCLTKEQLNHFPSE